jgi:hypothetical protein
MNNIEISKHNKGSQKQRIENTAKNKNYNTRNSISKVQVAVLIRGALWWIVVFDMFQCG